MGEDGGIVMDKTSSMDTETKGTPVDWAKADLRDLYWGKFLSTRQIADIFGVNDTKVRNEMKRRGIPRRTSKLGMVLRNSKGNKGA